MSENKPKQHFWRWAAVFLLAPIVFWYVATPQVSFHFSNKGKGRLGYILNVQHNISKGVIYPGEATGGAGHIFPYNQFFMEFDWNNGGKSYCIMVERNGRTLMCTSGQMVLSTAALMADLWTRVGHYHNKNSKSLALCLTWWHRVL